jgi:predicted CopG family antitoxin
MKTSYTIRIDSELIEKLKIKAKAENRSFNNYIETALKNHDDINLDVKNNNVVYFEFGKETYYIDNSTGEHIFDHWPTKKPTKKK